LSRLYPETELPMAAEALIKLLGALGEGLMSAFFIDPEYNDEALFISAFEAIAGDGGGDDRTALWTFVPDLPTKVLWTEVRITLDPAAYPFPVAEKGA
jgi:hypothetical protein